MDEHLNYKRMKTTSEKWTKIQRVIEKPETQLCLIEVPKGVSFFHFKQSVQYNIENGLHGFNLGEKLKSVSSANNRKY